MKSGIGPETLPERLLRLGETSDAALSSYLRSVQADTYDLLDLCVAYRKARDRVAALCQRNAPLRVRMRACDDYVVLAAAIRPLAWMVGVNVETVVRRYEPEQAAV